eukprot:3428379-Rhodomonas_salina.1
MLGGSGGMMLEGECARLWSQGGSESSLHSHPASLLPSSLGQSSHSHLPQHQPSLLRSAVLCCAVGSTAMLHCAALCSAVQQ